MHIAYNMYIIHMSVEYIEHYCNHLYKCCGNITIKVKTALNVT